jgi:hypothetical protein
MATGYMSKNELASALVGHSTGEWQWGTSWRVALSDKSISPKKAKEIADALENNPDIPLGDLGLNLGEDSEALRKMRRFVGTLKTARGEGSGSTADEQSHARDALNRGSYAADKTANDQAEFAAKEQQKAAQDLKAAAEMLKKLVPSSHFAWADIFP